MQGRQLERWRELCSQVAQEEDPGRFSELVRQLLNELEKEKERLRSGARDVAAD